jgi:hypothetical protein
MKGAGGFDIGGAVTIKRDGHEQARVGAKDWLGELSKREEEPERRPPAPFDNLLERQEKLADLVERQIKPLPSHDHVAVGVDYPK